MQVKPITNRRYNMEYKNYFEMHPVYQHVAIDWTCRSEVKGERDGFTYRIFDNPNVGKTYHIDSMSAPDGAVNINIMRNGETVLAGSYADYTSARAYINEYIDTILFNEQNPGASMF
jgi:hypothetical protein